MRTHTYSLCVRVDRIPLTGSAEAPKVVVVRFHYPRDQRDSTPRPHSEALLHTQRPDHSSFRRKSIPFFFAPLSRFCYHGTSYVGLSKG